MYQPVRVLSVVVKTARRPLLVVRLAESIRSVLQQDLPMIDVDDGPSPHPPEIMAEVGRFPLIKYVVADRGDLGISEGGLIGVNMVRTKYFVNMDDDNVVTRSWDAAKMTELLDTSDLTLVGARTDSLLWPAFLEFGYNEHRQPVIFHYKESCKAANQGLPFFPPCLRCDLTSNSFIARTRDVLEVGGWSQELKVSEHQDLFLRLKAAGKKVVWCPTFEVNNVHESESDMQTASEGADKTYYIMRYKRWLRMKMMFRNRWNVEDYLYIPYNKWKRRSRDWLYDM